MADQLSITLQALSRTGKSIKPHTTYQQFKADTLAPAKKVVSSDIPTFYLNRICKQQQDADAPLLFLSKVILREKSTIRPYLVSKRLYLPLDTTGITSSLP
ncbi:uncharacterized protein LOC143773748 [Ranitomeya variabilis]|uniref:uncharacterized protein LOC143773748 n=1 Tax=Ranitomeya variabilis TaxID=490064 RepID=UPI0040576F9B